MSPPELAPAEVVVLVDPRADRRADHVRALHARGAVVYAVRDCEAALEVLCETDGVGAVLLADVPLAAERALRRELDAFGALRPVRVVALHDGEATVSP